MLRENNQKLVQHVAGYRCKFFIKPKCCERVATKKLELNYLYKIIINQIENCKK